MDLDDTICAPATPPINSTIAIIRINGPEAFRAVKSIFSKSDNIRPRVAHYGSIVEKDKIIDDVIAVFYPSPKSFTGEDMVEIFCHGNHFIVHRIINLLNNSGVRMAEPGEFSKRAFLNGKMDLTEAEAINHIINARSEWEIETALKQMHGSLKEVINNIREDIILFKGDIEASIDFIEEDIEFVSHEDALNKANEIKDLITDLYKRCKTGEKVSHGIDVTISGKPNVGKSSILNLILNKERAIVSEIPGTTRDMIRESVQINGVHINLIDTAGINDTTDEIEKIGIELSHKNIESASIVLFIIDITTGINDTDRTILEKIKNKRTIYLANKIDIEKKSIACIEDEVNDKVIPFSAKTGEGLGELERVISKILQTEFVDYQNSFIADLRVTGLLEKSITYIDNIYDLITNKEPVEIIAFEIQSLIDSLSEITGEITPDHVLNSIFSRFCIGK